MTIRTYRPGDEEAQAAVYNEAAAGLPKFKPASVMEVRRRCQARDFDPATRFYAKEGGRVVGYATFQGNGRVSYPWCRPGHERHAGPLFRGVLEAMKRRGLRSAFAAYRGDWDAVNDFFRDQRFRLAREMVNFVLDLVDMPTATGKAVPNISPLERRDLAAVLRLGGSVLRVRTEAELEQALLANPYFGPQAVYALRDRPGGEPVAVGVFIENPEYSDPKAVDPAMPCFRLGAFGAEGLTTKRLNGMFSFLAGEQSAAAALGLDLMGHAVFRMQTGDLGTLAAQVASDAPHLLRFYQRHFRRQGSFPVFTRELDS